MVRSNENFWRSLILSRTGTPHTVNTQSEPSSANVPNLGASHCDPNNKITKLQEFFKSLKILGGT